MKIDPYLQRLSKTSDELSEELEREHKHEFNANTVPCLGNLIARKHSSMSPYEIPRSKGIFRTLAEVINRKHFKAIYPESFGTVPKYFRDTGISPYYEIMAGNDYANGVLTINMMIELTVSGYKWQLVRDQDVPIILMIVEEYYSQLKTLLKPNSTEPVDIQNRSYADKLDKFLIVMHAYAKKLRKGSGEVKPIMNIFDLLESYGVGG